MDRVLSGDNPPSIEAIAGNSADNDDPTSPGSAGISIVSFAPVTGTVISQNTFAQEAADIVFQAPAGAIEAHLNNFNGTGIGVDNEGTGFVDASQNWWACTDGPGAGGCATTLGSSISVQSWMATPFGVGRPGRPF